jgi:hypothetical protein
MKYVLGICLIIITFLALHFIYTENVPQYTSHTVYVSKDCTLNEVVAGSDYVFDCPK